MVTAVQRLSTTDSHPSTKYCLLDQGSPQQQQQDQAAAYREIEQLTQCFRCCVPCDYCSRLSTTDSQFEHKALNAGPTQPTTTAAAAGTSGDQDQQSPHRESELTKTLLLAVLAFLHSFNRNTTDRLPKQVQNIQHATREKDHLTKASNKRSQSAQQQQVRGEAAAAAKQQLLQAVETAGQRQEQHQ